MNLQSEWFPFSGHPLSDSCWSLSAGPDGRIYAAACCESQPGETVKLVRYNETRHALDYLFDLDVKAGDPRDSGRATQCKIHYSFAPSRHDGILFMATHLSGPPIDLPAYSPWYFWHDPERCFKGAALLAYDTKRDSVVWTDTLYPKEGCRCLLHDEDRGLLYSLSYPRDHLFVFDIARRRSRDLGRIGSINAQALFLDRRHRVWTTSDYGHLVRYDPDRDRVEVSPDVLPHNPVFQTGWHSVFYDVAPSPEGDCVYASTWIAQPHLIRIWPDEGVWGRVEDLGPATQERDPHRPVCTFLDHCGGLTFAGDGKLYYVASRWNAPDLHQEHDPFDLAAQNPRGIIWQLEPETCARREVGELVRPDYYAHYVPRGAVDHNGDLFFAHVGRPPVGIFRVPMPAECRRPDAPLPLRMWG
ncbi:MAG: hypothetical protein A2498_16955 [Lentisphaerae bacterium RIFOXYC12_FULL_60_16]|nr:MAG: hypothetical protein A2498_16955 [Lentisphaerae bacterium RIFOXYC12_FULL_60_16]OGV75424.1 MAG: hypothetical protein A2340_03700 [Lentisphaerae bacterium RIFOXYB12_FULL_60_10]